MLNFKKKKMKDINIVSSCEREKAYTKLVNRIKQWLLPLLYFLERIRKPKKQKQKRKKHK